MTAIPSASINEELNIPLQHKSAEEFIMAKMNESNLNHITDEEEEEEDKFLSQVPDVILNQSSAMMIELFTYLQKDIKDLQDEARGVLLKINALEKELRDIIKQKNKIGEKIDAAEKKLMEMGDELAKIDFMIANLEKKKQKYI